MIFGRKYLLLGGLLALVIAGAIGRVAAAEPAAPWDIGQLMQQLGRVESAKSTFVERKTLAMLTAPLNSSGTLVYTAPGRLEKYTLLPRPETLVLDGNRLTIEHKERNQRRTLVLQDYPVIWAFVESIRSTLAGDLKTLNRFYRTTLQGSEEQWQLSLRPAEPGMQAVVKEIHLSGSLARVHTVEIVEAAGDRSVMTITRVAP